MEQMAETGLAAILQLGGGGLDAPNTLNGTIISCSSFPVSTSANPQRKPQTKSKHWIGHIALYSHFASIRTVLRMYQGPAIFDSSNQIKSIPERRNPEQNPGTNNHTRKYRKARGQLIIQRTGPTSIAIA